MADKKKIWDQLNALKGITETTGILHDAQKFQLQAWGVGLLRHGRKIDIGVRLPWVENEGTEDEVMHDDRVIEYRVMSVGGPKPRDLQKRLKVLNAWVKKLLGDRFTVRVLVRGKLIFEGKGKSKKHVRTSS